MNKESKEKDEKGPGYRNREINEYFKGFKEYLRVLFSDDYQSIKDCEECKRLKTLCKTHSQEITKKEDGLAAIVSDTMFGPEEETQGIMRKQIFYAEQVYAIARALDKLPKDAYYQKAVLLQFASKYAASAGLDQKIFGNKYEKGADEYTGHAKQYGEPTSPTSESGVCIDP